MNETYKQLSEDMRKLKVELIHKGCTNIWADYRFRLKRWLLVIFYDTRYNNHKIEHEYALNIRDKSDAIKAKQLFNGQG